MASSLIPNINDQICEDVSTSFSYSAIFGAHTLKAVKIGQKLLYFCFFGYTSGSNVIPHAEEHMFSSTTFNSSVLNSSCIITGIAENGNVTDSDIATTVLTPDETGLKLSCNKANKRYLRISGLLYFK